MKYFSHTTVITFALVVLSLPVLVSAQASDYLVGIPGVTNGSEVNFNSYINAVYAMFISVAALLAVVKVIIAGVKYMFSDIVTQKSEAKKDIQSSLLGLVIVLAAVLILTVINPDLTNFDLDIETRDTPTSVSGGGNANDSNSSKVAALIKEGGEILSINSPGLTKEEKAAVCKNINQDICESSAAFQGSNPHCYSGEFIDHKDGICIVDKKSLVREGEVLSCDQLTTSGNSDSPVVTSCKDTGTCNGTDTEEIIVNCDAQIAACADGGYGYMRDTSLSGSQQIICTNNLPSTYSCRPLGRGEFNCDQARADCRATDRLPDPEMSVEPEKISCE